MWMERHRPDETDVSRAWPDPDWAGIFGTVQNLIEADVFLGMVQNLIETDVFCSELD